MAKLNLQQPLLQSSVSQDPLEHKKIFLLIAVLNNFVETMIQFVSGFWIERDLFDTFDLHYTLITVKFDQFNAWFLKKVLIIKNKEIK